MNVRRDELSMGFENERPGSPDEVEGPYEYPPLEAEVGCWAGWWSEFKRLWYLGWNDGHTKPVVISSTVVVVVTLTGMKLFGWR